MIRKRLVRSSSNNLVFLNPSFPLGLTAVIGQMAQSFVIGLQHVSETKRTLP